MGMKNTRLELTDSRGLSLANCYSVAGRLFAVVLAFCLLILSSMPIPANAYFTTCIANISPDSMSVGMSSTFAVSVTNGLSGPIRWVDVNVPSANYSYAGNAVGNGWTTSDHDGGTVISGSAMDVGQTQDFPIVVVSGSEASSSESWNVRVSQNVDGSSPVECTGSLQTSITGSLPQDTVNGVSGVAVSNITATQATVQWQTTNPSSTIVYYGISADYGSHSDFNDVFATEHSVQLTGLSPSTTYHYQVVGADVNGNYAHSIDSTFVTASEQSTQPSPQPSLVQQQSSQNVSTTATVIRPAFKPNPNDTSPPTITAITSLKGAFSTAPEIRVQARDNLVVSYAEYSTDAGRNWLPAQAVNGIGSTDAEFRFVPALSQDGSYSVVVRVFDAGGMSAISDAQTLVIDRLPPVVAGDVVTIGPEFVRPDIKGVLTFAQRQDVNIALSAVGGPTSITIEAVQTDNTNIRQSFSLSKSADSGLWSGVLSFLHPGAYDLTAYAVDGAQNKTQKILQKVTIVDPGKVIDAATKHPVKAEVTIYSQDPDTGQWVKWDGSSYGRQNPLKTGDNGGYTLYVPGGQYYLKIVAPGFDTVMSKTFQVDRPTLISENITMHKRKSLSLGALRIAVPGTGTRVIELSPDETPSSVAVASKATDMPTDTLKLIDGSSLKPTDLYGKPTVISFVSTWAPSAQDQLAILNRLDKTGIHVLAVVSGEASARVQAYMQIAGYNVRVVNDADNSLISRFGAIAMPTTYFVDRHGAIKRSAVGVLSSDQIVNNVVEAL